MADARPRPEGAGGAAPMLRPASLLERCTIGATDGDIGQVTDLYFDDQSWTVRYLVVDTGNWLPGRHVLVSPRAVTRVDAAALRLVTTLSKKRVADSPGIDRARPVSRQHETSLSAYYGYPFYWAGPYRWGATPFPVLGVPPGPPSSPVEEEVAARARESEDPHLRSAGEVKGYGLRATDGDLGHVEDYLVDEAAWAIRYLIVDPRSWWPGAHVVVSPEWISGIDWGQGKVEMTVTRQAVRDAPEYRPSGTFDREEERRLHAHYGRRAYWEHEPERWRIWPPAA